MQATNIVIPIDSAQIDRAQQRSSSHCMIADAIRDAHPDLSRISVDLQTIRFTNKKNSKRYIFLTPPAAQRALVNFDQGLPSEPMTITLRKPSQVLKAHTKANAPKNPDGTPMVRARANGAMDAVSPRQPKHVNNRGTVIGGRVPPNAALSNNRGRVRSFGLSQLKP